MGFDARTAKLNPAQDNPKQGAQLSALFQDDRFARAFRSPAPLPLSQSLASPPAAAAGDSGTGIIFKSGTASIKSQVLLAPPSSWQSVPIQDHSCLKMDHEHSADMFKHLEKQNEALMETYRAMSHELHRLQVEEELLMHKLYDVMSTKGLAKKERKEENDSNEVPKASC